MKKLLWLIAYCLLPIALCAQNWTTVSASNLTDLNQQKLAHGTLCFLGTDQNDIPISFQVGGGGQVLARPFCVAVTGGSSASLLVPNPQNTQPEGIYYRVMVNDTTTGQQVLKYTAVSFAGGTFNLDQYAPQYPGLVVAPLASPYMGNFSVNGNLSVTGSATLPGATNTALINGVEVVGVGANTTVQATINTCVASSTCDEVYIPAGVYTSSVRLDCPTTTGHWVGIRGAGFDPTQGTILRFTGATDGVQLQGYCSIEDVDIDTSNASGGIGLRFSGFLQNLNNVQITNSGSGLWAIGIQAFGAISSIGTNLYTTLTCCTIGAEVAPNGGNAVGGLSFIKSEFRGVTTGLHVTGNPGPLSLNIVNGAIENSGTNGILDDSTAGVVSVYGTQLEQNGTNDFNLTGKTQGSFNVDTTVHPGNATNLMNCPNTTCTATVVIKRMVSQCAACNLVLGNTAAVGSAIQNSIFAGSKFTNGARNAVTLFANLSMDATPIRDTIGDRGDGVAVLDMCSSAYGSIGCFTLQQSTGGVEGFTQNGMTALNINSAGVAQIPANSPLQFTEGTASGAASGIDDCYGDSTAHALKCSYNNGSYLNVPQIVASGTSTMASGSVSAATCAAAVTTAAGGAATTDAIEWAYATAPTLNTDALLTISRYVTSGNVNFVRCNPTAGAIVGTAIVINWRIVR